MSLASGNAQMTLQGKRLVLTLVFAGLAVAVTRPGFADGLVIPPEAAFDPSRLVKFDGRIYEIDYEDYVSPRPLRQVSVRKISYGKTRFVDIVTTPSGTYSTDGLFS